MSKIWLYCLPASVWRIRSFPLCRVVYILCLHTHTHRQTEPFTCSTQYPQMPSTFTCMSFYMCVCVCGWGVDFCLLRWQSTSIYAISSFWLNWFSVTISIQRESVCVSVWFTIWLFYLAILLGLVLASICKYLYKHIEGEVLLPSSLVLHRFVSCIWPKNASGIKSFLILRMYPMQHALSRLRKGGEGQPLLELVILRGSLRK